jgi:DNA-binding CsgD family transcriptional regulator
LTVIRLKFGSTDWGEQVPDALENPGRVVSPVLVGRDAELRRLMAAARKVPSVVVVEGEAGIGKTRLVAELAERPEVAGRRFLTGGCGQVREPFPLGPLVEALREVGADLAGAALTPAAGALRSLLPELAEVLPAAPAAVDDRAAVRHLLFRGLVEVLGALGPVVLVVEDLHWADEQTVEFLNYLLARPPAELSVVLTYRGEEAGPDVRAVTARPADTVTADHILLAPLDTARTRELAATILGVDDVSTAFAAHLCERASGLPLAIQELLALLRVRGELVRWEGGWVRRALEQLDVPGPVRDAVRERVGRLPEGARVVVEAAAVLQLAAPVPALAEVAGLARGAGPGAGLARGRPADDGAAAVDAALDSGLLAERDGLVGFRHVLAAQAVYEGIPVGRRQVLHGRAADAVRNLPRVPLGQVAHHLRAAGRLNEWADAADWGAARAMELGDASEAARLLEDVLRHTDPPPARRADLTIRLGWAAPDALRVLDIADLFAAALAHDLPREQRGELRFLRALQLELTRADAVRRHRAFAEAVADLGDRPDLAAWAMVNLGMPTNPDAALAEHRAWLDRALRTLPRVGDPALRRYLMALTAMVLVTIGDARWTSLAASAERESDGLPASRRDVAALRTLGEDACLAGHHDAAGRMLRTALKGAVECDVTGGAEWRCRTSLITVAYCRGDWAGLRESVEELRHGYGDRPHELSKLNMVATFLDAAPGDLEPARNRLRGILRAQEEVCDVDLLPLTASTLVRLGVACGAPAAAVAETSGAVALWEAKGVWPIGVRAVPALVEAMLAADPPGLVGERAGAARSGRHAAAGLVERYAAALPGLEAPLAGPALAHARGILAAADSGWTHAAALFTTAAEAYRDLPAQYEAAQCDEQAAAGLFQIGDADARRRAERSLSAAIAAYQEMGARWDLDRARGLARRHGLRPAPVRRGEPDGADALTSRQLQVARLAAEGRTNQEIARELFLSAKTVDKHLSAALHKLGLRSRVELARQLGE